MNNTQELIRAIISHIGDDPQREGLRETPNRVIRSWDHLYSGYNRDPAKLLKTFKEENCDEMVILRDVEFYSTCEHHMQPFYGRAHVGYLPRGRVVGVSKLARLLEVFSRRLQIQERIGAQVAAALMEHLKPRGAGVVLEARHHCMCARGVEKQNSIMVTSSMQGAFRKNASVKSEFLRMIGKP